MFLSYSYEFSMVQKPVMHEGRHHAVEGYPAQCNDGLFLLFSDFTNIRFLYSELENSFIISRAPFKLFKTNSQKE